ncbi:hypothetical protein B0H13DRAFT_2309835 [Mycena leptocephala]|nr:hypothetical protein B0H13DRAFT_2309835 [Mycena leptocephala]
MEAPAVFQSLVEVLSRCESPTFVLLTFSRLLVSSSACLSPITHLMHAFLPSMFASLTFSRLLVSILKCFVHAFPLLPMFVLLTFSRLLVSSNECMRLS